jgi:hypothetical protein
MRMRTVHHKQLFAITQGPDSLLWQAEAAAIQLCLTLPGSGYIPAAATLATDVLGCIAYSMPLVC